MEDIMGRGIRKRLLHLRSVPSNSDSSNSAVFSSKEFLEQFSGRRQGREELTTEVGLPPALLFGTVIPFAVSFLHSVSGLKTALVELDDFSSGTSSRSTKLIHGGVRYLQAAIMKADIEQYRMVKVGRS